MDEIKRYLAEAKDMLKSYKDTMDYDGGSYWSGCVDTLEEVIKLLEGEKK